MGKELDEIIRLWVMAGEVGWDTSRHAVAAEYLLLKKRRRILAGFVFCIIAVLAGAFPFIRNGEYSGLLTLVPVVFVFLTALTDIEHEINLLGRDSGAWLKLAAISRLNQSKE